jgi:polyferredoxin
VEGFLPIGALMGWKRFLLTGRWDAVHPAAMVILGFAVLLSFVFRKAFCSWFCPVGTISEWCWRAGRRLLKKDLQMPPFMDILLRSAKYILLGFFLWAITRMGTGQILAFMESPYYQLADAKMLLLFTQMSVTTAVVLSCLMILSLLFKNFWCRYLCPYGALLGLFSWMSPTRIERSETFCVHCGQCDSACPSRLSVSRSQVVRSPECTGCMDCVAICPEEAALSLVTPGFSKAFWHPVRACFFVIVLFAAVVYAAHITGHWQRGVSDRNFKTCLGTIHSPKNQGKIVERPVSLPFRSQTGRCR